MGKQEQASLKDPPPSILLIENGQPRRKGLFEAALQLSLPGLQIVEPSPGKPDGKGSRKHSSRKGKIQLDQVRNTGATVTSLVPSPPPNLKFSVKFRNGAFTRIQSPALKSFGEDAFQFLDRVFRQKRVLWAEVNTGTQSLLIYCKGVFKVSLLDQESFPDATSIPISHVFFKKKILSESEVHPWKR